MPEEYHICPYTGLRSFTEDESLYFKGREEDIDQATLQLQRNKFLMLTGASGDGKSSLVYAGIIPNARAGFLKSKYTSWCVADFRPERDPFNNLCKSLAWQLEIENLDTVSVELNHGFSAVTDLYKNSNRYIDQHSSAWLKADDKTKAAMKREAANLIILVDQFEEFFTNPENYQHGVPSGDANLVLNLLLETARIALEEDLPVYVVFTMRSDYIGQCAAFRGLPEYLGFSQFFVPRLNRSQLQQVIEEPATLSGNRITRRLTERLVHDLTEGVDQLPILQHALNQIWVAASMGAEEMDLIHYAKVGGMSVNELPDEQVGQFNTWFAGLAPEIKACYHAPNLQNVLDTHTNKLYEQAAGYYLTATGKRISVGTAKMIIRTAFSCLTKIDQSRAVRNRMTLQEITNILGDPAIDTNTVGGVLNIFREPGNTFIHPFISDEDPGTAKLNASQVLDITHESLIRNWEYLGQWAKEEFDSYSISQDFERQLGRWVNSGKSNSFLLSIGPLTYFENWYNTAKPNAYWIARYLPEETDKELKLVKADEILANSREFLKHSARKHTVTRTVIRYGPKRIIAVLGILAMIVLTSFVVKDFYNKQNSTVLKSIHDQALHLADNPKVGITENVTMLAELLKVGQTTVDEIANSVKDTLQKIKISNGLASLLIYQGRSEPKKEIYETLKLSDSLLEQIPFPGNNGKKLSAFLYTINNYRVILELAYLYNPEEKIAAWRMRNAARSARWVKMILQNQPPDFNDMQNFNYALENALNFKAFSESDLNEITGTLSPFENGLKSEWLTSNFNKDKLLNRGLNDYGIKFNGLYQELAYLYAASGNTEKVLRCMDSLLLYSQNNFQGDYAWGADNATNIASVYFRNTKSEPLNVFVEGYCTRKKITEEEFYEQIIGRMVNNNFGVSNLDLYFWMTNKSNLNLSFCGWQEISFFFNNYRQVVEKSTVNADQKNFLLALAFKNEAIYKSLRNTNPASGTGITELFDNAIKYYRSVDPKYLEQSIVIAAAVAMDQKVVPRKFIFLYPDLKFSIHPGEPRNAVFYYFSDAFVEYILSAHLFTALYNTRAELEYFTLWLELYNSENLEFNAFSSKRPHFQVLKDLSAELEKRDSAKTLDLNWLHLYAGREAQLMGNETEMLKFYDKLQYNNIFSLVASNDYDGLIRSQSFRLIGFAVMGYIKAGKTAHAYEMVRLFKNPINRSTLYSFAASELLRDKVNGKQTQELIDSSKAEAARAVTTSGSQPQRRLLAYTLTLQKPEENSSEAYALIKNLRGKFNVIQHISRSFAFNNDLYGAQHNTPEFISGSDKADFLWNILFGYTEGKGTEPKTWKQFTNNYAGFATQNIEYVDDNN